MRGTCETPVFPGHSLKALLLGFTYLLPLTWITLFFRKCAHYLLPLNLLGIRWQLSIFLVSCFAWCVCVHVVTKATRDGWRNNSITNLMSGNLTSSRYKCQFLINIQSRNNQVKYHIFLSRQLGNTEWSAKNFCWPPGLLVDSLPSHVSLVHPFFFFWPYYNTFKPCYAGYPPMELKLRLQHRFFSFQTHIVQNWMDSRW